MIGKPTVNQKLQSMYTTPREDERDNDFLANTSIPAYIRDMPKEYLHEMTERYLQEKGLNLAGLGEEYSTSDDGSECEDLMKCQHLIKKVEFKPKVDWRKKIDESKEKIQKRLSVRKSVGALPNVYK